jgi:TnpA family transposase
MSHARLLGFDLCPRLKELKQRHLFVPRGTKVPAEIAAVCEANVDVALIEKHWDSLVHLAASVMSGHASAVAALARFGSAAQGDPIYEAGVQLGRLLRTAFLADYFVKDAFRNELRRVLNRGEAVNALKRAIYTGRISPAQAKRVDEMQAVASRCVEPDGQHRDGVEYLTDAGGPGSLVEPPPGHSTGTDREDCAHQAGEHQLAGCVSLPG